LSVYCVVVAVNKVPCLVFFIGFWHHAVVSVCPSVPLWHCALWLNDTSYSKCLNKRGSWFYNFQPPIPSNYSWATDVGATL